MRFSSLCVFTVAAVSSAMPVLSAPLVERQGLADIWKIIHPLELKRAPATTSFAEKFGQAVANAAVKSHKTSREFTVVPEHFRIGTVVLPDSAIKNSKREAAPVTPDTLLPFPIVSGSAKFPFQFPDSAPKTEGGPIALREDHFRFGTSFVPDSPLEGLELKREAAPVTPDTWFPHFSGTAKFPFQFPDSAPTASGEPIALRDASPATASPSPTAFFPVVTGPARFPFQFPGGTDSNSNDPFKIIALREPSPGFPPVHGHPFAVREPSADQSL